MRKILSAVMGVLSLGVAAFTLWLCVYAGNATPKLETAAGEPGQVLTRFFDCLKAENWEEAYACLDGNATLGLETAPSDGVSALFWQAQKDAWAFQVSDDWTQDGVYVETQVTVRGLDMDAIRDAISGRVQALLAEAVEQATLSAEVYQADGSFREDVAMAALGQAEDEVLRSVSEYQKDRTLTVRLRLYDREWYIQAGQELISALTSGAGAMPGFELYINNLTAAAMDGVLPIPKLYYLAEDVVVAPEPDQSRFGASMDPADTAQVLADASALLAGADTIWRTDTELMAGMPVRWYLDETIFSIVWKEVIDDIVYTFSEVKIAHPSQFRRYLAGDTFSSPVQYTPSEMAISVNAVAAMSGDYYKYRNMGYVVYRRELYRNEGEEVDTCFVDSDGNMNFVRHGELTTEAEVRQYIQNNDILFSLAFGPVLIEDGKNVVPDAYAVGEINALYARAALCQVGEGHYLMVAANGENGHTHVPTVRKMADHLLAKGVSYRAYALDGGQTATIIQNDRVINRVAFGEERYVSDIVYFATALPAQGEGA